MTVAEIEAEYWAYHYLESTAKEEIEDDEFDADAYVAELEARALAREAELALQEPPPAAPDTPPTPDDWEDIP